MAARAGQGIATAVPCCLRGWAKHHRRVLPWCHLTVVVTTRITTITSKPSNHHWTARISPPRPPPLRSTSQCSMTRWIRWIRSRHRHAAWAPTTGHLPVLQGTNPFTLSGRGKIPVRMDGLIPCIVHRVCALDLLFFFFVSFWLLSWRSLEHYIQFGFVCC